MLNIDRITIRKIKKVKDFQNKKALEIARKARIPIEAVTITLERLGYKVNY